MMLRRLIKAWKRAISGRLSQRFAFSRNGNVAVIAAFSMLPMALALGVGVDYAIQKRGQDQLDGIADAAALIATTPSMMTQTATTAQTAAQNFWNTQSPTVFNVNQPVSATVSVIDSVNSGGTVRTRTATVAWSGTSNTFLSGVVGRTTLPIGGTSKASASSAPNINFYLLVDTSPSMAIPATTAGIAAMVANTGQTQDGTTGCAFACHEANPSGLGNPSIANPANGTTCCVGQDNYAVARALGLTLRIDLVNQAVSNLLSTAASMAATNLTTYGLSISTINYEFNPIFSTGNISYAASNNISNLQAAQNAVSYNSNMQLLEVSSNNCLFSSNCNYDNGGSDQDSLLDLGVATLGTVNSNAYTTSNTCYLSTATSSNTYVTTAAMPSNPCNSGTSNPSNGPGFQMYKPGNGTNNSGDTPQEVLFIITDGVVDEYMSNTSGVSSEYLDGTRVQAPINTVIDNCTAIKAKGIRIAFLYLTYNPMVADGWYNTYVGPWQSQIQPAAQACASPGLFQQVNSDEDISAALNNLFQTAVATAHLTQ